MRSLVLRSAQKVGLILVFYLALLSFGSTYAQDHSGIEQLSYVRTMWDFAYDVTTEDTLAYLATGFSGLQILSIANPELPEFVGDWQDMSMSLTRVTVSENRVFAAAGSQGFVTIDVSDPLRPRRDRHFQNYDVVHDVQIRDNYAFVAAFREGLKILEISDPVEFEEIAGIDTPGELRGLFVADDIAYLADGRSGLQIVDIWDPTSPEIIGSLDVGGTVDRVFVHNNLAYLISGAIILVIVDVSDPEAPEVLSQFEQDQIPYDIEANDTLACLTYGGDLRILDISDPNNPDHLAFIDFNPSSEQVRGVSLIGNLICTSAGFGGFYTTDLNEFSGRMRPIGGFNCRGEAINLTVLDTLVYASKLSDGIMIMEAGPIGRKRILNFFGSSAKDFWIDRGYLFYVFSYYFNIADLANPIEPGFITNLRGSGGYEGIFIKDSLAYICAINGGLRIFNISDPEETMELGWNDVIGHHYDLVVSDGFCYLADASRGLQIMNVTDPTNPFREGYVNIDSHSLGYELWLADTLLYFAVGNAGLLVFDITTREDPVEIARFDPEAPVRDVIVNGDYAYLACGEDGLTVLNITDLNSMHVVGFHDTPGDAQGLFLDQANDLVYVADGMGIGIFDASQALKTTTPCEEPLTPTVPLFSVFPNPANANFNFYFNIFPAHKGSLIIYDIYGRLIHREPFIQGDTFIHWDARNIPSGTYIASLEGYLNSPGVQIILQK